eukprot:01808.XXX_6824_7063_1 [CDS] Oithona nana genome sequencing.
MNRMSAWNGLHTFSKVSYKSTFIVQMVPRSWSAIGYFDTCKSFVQLLSPILNIKCLHKTFDQSFQIIIITPSKCKALTR